jgi:hypothetical protein
LSDLHSRRHLSDADLFGGELDGCFDQDPLDSLVMLGEYLSRHGRWESRERELLDVAVRAFSESADNVAFAMVPSHWDVDRLIEIQEPHEWSRIAIRKPKIFVDYDRTIKGNLRVRWFPDEREGSDFLHHQFYYTQIGPTRSPGELFFLRNFDVLVDAVKKDDGGWKYGFRNVLLKVCLYHAQELAVRLNMCYDVTMRHRPFVTFRDERLSSIDLRFDGAPAPKNHGLALI